MTLPELVAHGGRTDGVTKMTWLMFDGIGFLARSMLHEDYVWNGLKDAEPGLYHVAGCLDNPYFSWPVFAEVEKVAA